MYYSYVDIEYVPTKKYEFCSRRKDLAVKLLMPSINALIDGIISVH